MKNAKQKICHHAWLAAVAAAALIPGLIPSAQAQEECWAESKILVVDVVLTGTKIPPKVRDQIGAGVARRCYDQDSPQEPKARLLQSLHDAGYLRAEVDDPAVETIDETSHPKQISLSFPVHEGPQYSLGSVQWEGVVSITPMQMEEMIDMHPGEPYDSHKTELAARRIRERYRINGYKGTRVTIQTSLRDTDDGHTVALTFKVEEGQK